MNRERNCRGVLRVVWLAAAICVIASEHATAQFAANLTVQVVGLRNQEGNVCFKVFNGSRGFPDDNDSAVQRQCVAIAENLPENPEDPFSITFSDLNAGSYAVAIYHDRNSDEQLNRGTFNLPLEGYGFSNDAPARNGPADYEDAVFVLGISGSAIQIQMRYPQ
jgi:uncharacterized protein (DUF2141 family)